MRRRQFSGRNPASQTRRGRALIRRPTRPARLRAGFRSGRYEPLRRGAAAGQRRRLPRAAVRYLERSLRAELRRGRRRFREVVRLVFDANILCGDALTLKRADGSPIIFAEWSFIDGSRVKRRDFQLDKLIEANEKQKDSLLPVEDEFVGYDWVSAT